MKNRGRFWLTCEILQRQTFDTYKKSEEIFLARKKRVETSRIWFHVLRTEMLIMLKYANRILSRILNVNHGK